MGFGDDLLGVLTTFCELTIASVASLSGGFFVSSGFF